VTQTVTRRSPDLRRLVAEALDEFEEVPLSASHRRAVRIARLRGDLTSLWWLTLEHGSMRERRKTRDELRPHFSEEEFKRRHSVFTEEWIEERSIPQFGLGGVELEDMVESSNIEGIERKVRDLMSVEEDERSLGNITLVTWARNSSANLAKVLGDIRARIFNFLTATEAQVLGGQRPDTLVRTREFVLSGLERVAPEAAEQILEAERALGEGRPEPYSQAVLSCRRAFKSLADAVFPARKQPVVGSDGITRELTEEKYITRLWQFVFEAAGGHRSGDLALANIGDLGRRIDAVHDATQKGVHDSVDEVEAHQFVTQTILLAGDILRLHTRTSAIAAEVEDSLPDSEMPTAPPSSGSSSGSPDLKRGPP
jgi:hypothetical protein